MADNIIAEGKTTQEAIEKGLKILNCTKDMVEINVLENTEKRSFFSILTPRVVRVELKLKKEEIKPYQREQNVSEKPDKMEERKEKIESFLREVTSKINNQVNFNIETSEKNIYVKIEGELLGYLIGYRGETLNALQIILSRIANKDYTTTAKVILDINNYRNKRKEILEELAVKVSKKVLRTGKSETLDPMPAYERKIIHDKLQENNQIITHSVGDEPYRKVVISKKII